MKKNILVTGGGTAIAWHICQVCKKYYDDDVQLFICDINDKYLVPSSIYAKKFFKVPYPNDSKYLEVIKSILVNEKIDIVIPIIPEENFLLSSDSDIVKTLKIISSAPEYKVSEALSDKRKMFNFLSNIGIPSPTVYDIEHIKADKEYFVKPKLGFGSIGTGVVLGKDILLNKEKYSDDVVIQEYCHSIDYEEITVEVFNGDNMLEVFARKRVATKSGVCVKMIPYDREIFIPMVKKLVSSIKCPIAFNLQFLRNNNEWKLFDCNMRLGAGTALSSKIGFELTRAFIGQLIGKKVLKEWFNVDNEIVSVLRVYDEVVIK